MMTSFELEQRARDADCQGLEQTADQLYALANEAREVEEDMAMSLPRNERSTLYGAWCHHQRSLYHGH